MIRTLVSNYKKPTPPKWRKVGDFALVMIPLIMGAIPNLPISPDAQTWSMQISSLLLVAVKFWSNTKVVKNHYEGSL